MVVQEGGGTSREGFTLRSIQWFAFILEDGERGFSFGGVVSTVMRTGHVMRMWYWTIVGRQGLDS